MTKLLWHLGPVVQYIYIFKKGKYIAFRNYHQVDFTGQLLFFCDESEIFEQITFEEVGITGVGLYPRTFYKLYLHHYLHAACSMVIIRISGHCTSQYYDI